MNKFVVCGDRVVYKLQTFNAEYLTNSKTPALEISFARCLQMSKYITIFLCLTSYYALCSCIIRIIRRYYNAGYILLRFCQQQLSMQDAQSREKLAGGYLGHGCLSNSYPYHLCSSRIVITFQTRHTQYNMHNMCIMTSHCESLKLYFVPSIVKGTYHGPLRPLPLFFAFSRSYSI